MYNDFFMQTVNSRGSKLEPCGTPLNRNPHTRLVLQRIIKRQRGETCVMDEVLCRHPTAATASVHVQGCHVRDLCCRKPHPRSKRSPEDAFLMLLQLFCLRNCILSHWLRHQISWCCLWFLQGLRMSDCFYSVSYVNLFVWIDLLYVIFFQDDIMHFYKTKKWVQKFEN